MSKVDTAPKSEASTLSEGVRNTYRSMCAARAEKGAARARAVTRVRDQGAVLLAAALNAPAAASQAMIGLPTVSVLNGTETRMVLSIKAIDALRALVYGSAVQGSAKIDYSNE